MAVTKETLSKEYNIFKGEAFRRSEAGDFQNSLLYIDLCARIAYTFNFIYIDDELEDLLAHISSQLLTKPEFKSENALKNTNKLPSFFWTGNTKMNCLKNSINSSLDNGYAHHIQRLMVTGNYALLTQTNPDEVDAWYLGVYVDAVEWVQLPNTRGMSQFADGGKIATKPYVSSGSYIDKMSNYCDSCFYNKSKK